MHDYGLVVASTAQFVHCTVGIVQGNRTRGIVLLREYCTPPEIGMAASQQPAVCQVHHGPVGGGSLCYGSCAQQATNLPLLLEKTKAVVGVHVGVALGLAAGRFEQLRLSQHAQTAGGAHPAPVAVGC